MSAAAAAIGSEYGYNQHDTDESSSKQEYTFTAASHTAPVLTKRDIEMI